MGSSERTNEKEEKKTVEFSDVILQQTITKIISKSLQGVLEDIQTIKDINSNLQLMIRGIHVEIQEIKSTTQGLGQAIKDLIDGKTIKKSIYVGVGEISTGLDLVTKIPQHLRRTFQEVLQLDKPATAREVSTRTGKSRPLESDYLNQLVERGLLSKRHRGKKVEFFYNHVKEAEETNGLDSDESNNFVTEKQLVVNNANNTQKKSMSIKTQITDE